MSDVAERMAERAERAVTVMVDEEATPNLPVHPAAAVFPMLSDAELHDLADDIKANGQIHPIMLDKAGTIVDGRNRFAACKLAGVEPQFMTLPEDADPVTFILSANIERRHMSKGQQAVAIAMTRVFSKNGTVRQFAAAIGVAASHVSYAATVLEHARDLAEPVLAGALSLNQAYEQARSRKDAATSMEAHMGTLRAEAPDLADLVVEERVTLREALALLDKRHADARRQSESATAGLLSAVRFLAPPSGDIGEHADKLVRLLDTSLVSGAEAINPESIARSIAFLEVVQCGLIAERRRNGRTEAQSVPS